MIIYEVNLNINSEIYNEFYTWLLTHIKDMLKFEGFQKAEVGLVEFQETDHEKKIRVSYTIDSANHLENYFQMHATKMRALGLEKFGNNFSATRRVLVEALTITP